MPAEIRPNIFYVGARDWDRRLFDELIPLPDGTTYNAYLIKGSTHTALLDTVDPPKTDELLANLAELGVEQIDYLVAHHAEQDHAGAIPAILARYPTARVVTNAKCRDLLQEHLLVAPERFLVVEDGEQLTLGDRTLQFVFTPWVHWPETMCTYLVEDQILFSCDFFGAHLATSELFVTNETQIYQSAKRYFAEIMMPFRSNVIKDIAKVNSLPIQLIAPSHGPVYSKPDFIINAYREWTDDRVKNLVLIPYVSMHGSTERMVQYLVKKLIERNIEVKPYNLTRTDIGELAMDLVDAATVVLGTPTVILGPHPQAVTATFLLNLLRPKVRWLSVIGSYGWGGKTLEVIKSLVGNLKAELLEPVYIKGYPKEQDFRLLDQLADQIAAKHATI